MMIEQIWIECRRDHEKVILARAIHIGDGPPPSEFASGAYGGWAMSGGPKLNLMAKRHTGSLRLAGEVAGGVRRTAAMLEIWCPRCTPHYTLRRHLRDLAPVFDRLAEAGQNRISLENLDRFSKPVR